MRKRIIDVDRSDAFYAFRKKYIHPLQNNQVRVYTFFYAFRKKYIHALGYFEEDVYLRRGDIKAGTFHFNSTVDGDKSIYFYGIKVADATKGRSKCIRKRDPQRGDIVKLLGCGKNCSRHENTHLFNKNYRIISVDDPVESGCRWLAYWLEPIDSDNTGQSLRRYLIEPRVEIMHVP